MTLCAYKDMFGKPGTGVHAYRLFDVAVVDVVMTIVFGYLAAMALGLTAWKVILALFILGIVLHRLFCVRTTVDKLISRVMDD